MHLITFVCSLIYFITNRIKYLWAPEPRQHEASRELLFLKWKKKTSLVWDLNNRLLNSQVSLWSYMCVCVCECVCAWGGSSSPYKVVVLCNSGCGVWHVSVRSPVPLVVLMAGDVLCSCVHARACAFECVCVCVGGSRTNSVNVGQPNSSVHQWRLQTRPLLQSEPSLVQVPNFVPLSTVTPVRGLWAH